MTKSAGSRLRLSVLDQSPISEGSTLGGALRNSIDLAVLADSMGYHRYWVAEHHGSAGFSCMSPEDFDWADRSRYIPNSSRERRRYAPPLQPVQSGRKFQYARKPLSGSDRSRRRGLTAPPHLLFSWTGESPRLTTSRIG